MLSRPVGSARLAAALLVAVCGCDRGTSEAVDAIVPSGAPALDLDSMPQLLFQVFGERDDPRLLPLAAVVNGAIKPIGLTLAGWRALDSIYFAPGAKYTVYRDDNESGEFVVARGMWTGGRTPLYPLPGCRALIPHAAGVITFNVPHLDATVEFVASSAPLARHAPYKGAMPTEAEVAKLGRAIGHALGKRSGMDQMELDSLDFHARMIVTGATSEPTLIVSFIDPTAGDLGAGAGHTSHLFLLADKPGDAWDPTYRHAMSGEARTVEFRRVVDHLDVNGDGIDEIILETWRYGARPDLVVLSFKAGQWHEALRVRQNWCLDPGQDQK